jgi:hypothetical protein
LILAFPAVRTRIVTLVKTTGRPGLADAVQGSGAGGCVLGAAAEDVTVGSAVGTLAAGVVGTLAAVFPPEVQPASTPAAMTPMTVNVHFMTGIVT